MMDFLKQGWPWYVAGPLIALIMFNLLLLGKSFGVSSTLRTACAMCGAGKISGFFKFNWKSQLWNILFVSGALIGGVISNLWLNNPNPINLAPETINNIKHLNISKPGDELLPQSLFTWESILTPEGFIVMVLGGFLIGFGSRYAGGCTSGHAISGLSDMQLPSLVAVAGFFIGGLLMTYFMLPLIFK